MEAPRVFISYSHLDDEWKLLVVKHLKVLEKQHILDVWDDTRIGCGDDWRKEIEQAINTAQVGILLISKNFLTSDFILDEEIPRLLLRRQNEGIKIFPIIVSPCVWDEINWLKKMNCRPKDGKPLSGGTQHQIDSDLTSFTKEVLAILKEVNAQQDNFGATLKFSPPHPTKISLSKLPVTDLTLFGREKELALLDEAWNSRNANILSLVAWGGVGKSALVNKWLDTMRKENYRGAELVFGWSFYSQGATEGKQTSADEFIASALEWFGDSGSTKGSPWQKGERLTELISEQRTLLILDGLEPLQNPVESGRIQDPALSTLLRELKHSHDGLVVITTRFPVDGFQTTTSGIQHNLEQLSAEAGAAYLKYLGVKGSDSELQDVSNDLKGHALALTLAGTYLKIVYDCDSRRYKEIPRLINNQKEGKHAQHIMEAYERWYKDKPELEILRLMGLFDRPAPKGAIEILRKKPAIKRLTEKLQKLSDADWMFAINNLRSARLLSEQDPKEPDKLDCHPLLREHFGETLKKKKPIAWQQANGRLYEYYKALPTKEYPDTLEEMAPLLAAVIHGCQAGLHKKAYDEVYYPRIRRGTADYLAHNLGAFSADLSMISGFFVHLWEQIVVNLNEDNKIWIFNTVGYDLRALGRLAEAVEPIKISLKMCITQSNLVASARVACNLSELLLLMGNVAEAIQFAEDSIKYADRGDYVFLRIITRSALADALLRQGNFIRAKELFSKAEEIQKVDQPMHPLLYSFHGFLYCDLLLEMGKFEEVLQRAEKTIQWVAPLKWLLDIALDNLSIGQAYFLREQQEDSVEFNLSTAYLDQALEDLRKAGQQDTTLKGLLARAELYRAKKEFPKAQKDLAEVEEIATRSGMRLHLTDYHLESARLYIAMKEAGYTEHDTPPEHLLKEAREHLKTATKLVGETGYHRRDKEVQELEIQLGVV